MTDVFWTALLSAGGALLAATITQGLNILSNTRAAQRTKLERDEGWAREDAKDDADRLRADLREFWEIVLQASAAIHTRVYGKGAPVEMSATSLMSRARAIALVSFPRLGPIVEDFHDRTTAVEAEIAQQARRKNNEPADKSDTSELIQGWFDAFALLERGAIAEAKRLTDKH